MPDQTVKRKGLLFEFPDVGHPGTAESLIPIWGAGREALADAHDGDVWGAVGNGLLAVTDVVPAKALGGIIVKGGFKAAPKGWKTARAALGKEGFAAPGQHLHHWAIPQSGWGKKVPGEIKNAKWNLLPMPSAEVHGRLTGSYLGKPQYNPVERYFRGTPVGVQAGVVSVGGHGVAAATDKRQKPR
jgi:hypothetical protein